MTQQTKPGTKVSCIRRDGARKAQCGDWITVPIWTGAVFEARRRIADGVITWRRVSGENFGGTRAIRHPSRRWSAEVKADAPHPWDDTVAHGQVAL